jgi:type II secretory pathway pseudopilin PulG
MHMTPRSPDSGEEGVTLVELVISVMILGIVIAAIFGALASLTASERRSQNRVQAQEELRTAVLDMSRDLRSATLLDTPTSISAAGSSIAFTRADGLHGRWRLDTASKTILREVENPTGSGTWAVVRRYRDIRNGDDGTTFIRYYGSGNQRLESSTTLTDLTACTLRLRLTVKGAVSDVPTPYTTTMDVALRNKGSRGVTGC